MTANCRCEAYSFPHRPGSGACPGEPTLHDALASDEPTTNRARLDRDRPWDVSEEGFR